MGLFSKIKKAVKGVFKGIKKVFKKVMTKIGKVLSSKWGKALMLALAVFTAGTALVAGAGAFSSTAGTFMTKFVAGAKEFIGALANPFGKAKELIGGAGKAAAGAANTAASSAAAGAAEGAAGAAGAATAPMDVLAGGAVEATQAATAATGAVAPAAAQAATQAATTAANVAKPGLLSRAATGAMNFLKSPGGGTLVGNVAQGMAAGAQQEELLKKQEEQMRYYDEQWRDPTKVGQLNAAVRDVQTPGGYLERARRVSNFMNGRPYGSAPSAPGNPDDVYGTYVRTGTGG